MGRERSVCHQLQVVLLVVITNKRVVLVLVPAFVPSGVLSLVYFSQLECCTYFNFSVHSVRGPIVLQFSVLRCAASLAVAGGRVERVVTEDMAGHSVRV